MITGFILGIMLGLLLTFIVLFIVEIATYRGVETYLQVIIGVVITTLSCIIGTIIGIQIDRVDYDKKINNWKNTKQIIETAIKDENISDLEKISLVNDIVTYNMQLTELKEDVKQWWNLHLDDKKVNELEIIKID